jgi:glycosyltransferase involved in cell wall biosynthesis
VEDIVSSLAATCISAAGADASDDSDGVAQCMHKGPLVSVIVPCYNGAAFLEEALKSAMSQSYPHVEVIVVDDGSTDNSPEIAQRFPVRYIRQENRGLAGARNTGIRESKGSYLVFLDADDRLRPEAIATGLRVLEPRPECAIAVGDHVFMSADSSYRANSRKDCLAAFHYEALLKSNFIEMISTVLFRRSVIDEVGGFNTSLRVAEDYELYLRIARAYPICCHPAIVAEYRIHEAALSRNSELMLTTTLGVLKSQAKYILYDIRRLVAYHEGVRLWRKMYGRQLALEVARSFSTSQRSHLVRKLLLLTNQYPQGLLMLGFLRIMPGLDRSLTWSQQRVPVSAGNISDARRLRFITDLVASQKEKLLPKVTVPTQEETAPLK